MQIVIGDAGLMASKILSGTPAIFVSRTHFTDSELTAFEDSIEDAGGTLTYDILDASILLSKVSKRTRLLFDLRAQGVTIEPSESSSAVTKHEPVKAEKDTIVAIEIKDDDSTATETEASQSERSKSNTIKAELPKGVSAADNAADASPELPTSSITDLPKGVLTVIRSTWVKDSLEASKLLPLSDYAVLSGHVRRLTAAEQIGQLDAQPDIDSSLRDSSPVREDEVKSPKQSILERAKEDASRSSGPVARSLKRKFQGHTPSLPRNRDQPSWAPGQSTAKYAHLLHASTSEEDHGFSSDIPEPPEWVLKGVKYACQRSTLMGSPNEAFVDLLRKIKLARLLTSDEIGVRAYSTSIAAILAYPYKFISPTEILQLPGCEAKIANLFVEYANTGSIKAVEDIEADHDLGILRLFYNIWGVGGLTAREFYFDRGWQDLDDLVEYNWKGLSRVQQIGVKYYEEFLDPIPRPEVEEIGRIVHEHAVKVRNKDIQSMIVGGYRRGKNASGDVDIIVSHPDEDQTLDIITDIVASLEDDGWITHTLLLSTNNSRRDQQTLPFRSGDMHGGHGFDSLDKALVVWQDPSWPSQRADLAANPKAKNPNIHRRVDIIIAPWRTVGCAVLGWSGGTTFQRDIRRYVRHLFGWKFDSSGIRDRGNGEVLDLEGFHRYDGKLGEGRAKTMLEAEKRVFEGLKLEYREAWERCTD